MSFFLLAQRLVLLLLISLVGFLAGCSTNAGSASDLSNRWLREKMDRPIGVGFTPQNVFRSAETLPADIRRVALLPLSIPRPDAQFSEGRDVLAPILERQFNKRQAFEIIRISSDQLRRWTGRPVWNAEEPLPPELLIRLREQYGCQAVIFSQLTQFHPYGPVQIGWSLKLVDTRRAEIYWAVDEVFDAGVPAVANSARRFAQDDQNDGSPLPDSSFVLSSPRRFGEYSLHAVLATLPVR